MDLKSHGTDEQLELYALHRLPDAETTVLEEHLLLCAPCQERLTEVENFALGMREALISEPVPAEKPVRADWFAWLRRPAFGMAVALAAVILMIFTFTRIGNPRLAPVATIQLSAMRGQMKTVQPARETDIDLTDVSSTQGSVHVDLVDGSGRKVWGGVGVPAGGNQQLKIQQRLDAGDYYIRLYGPDGNLQHEYGFRVQGE